MSRVLKKIRKLFQRTHSRLEWKEPKEYVSAIRKIENEGKPLWKRINWGLIGTFFFLAAGYLAQLYLPSFIPGREPPPVWLTALCVVGPLFIVLTIWGAYRFTRPAISVTKHGVSKFQGNKRQLWKYKDIYAFYFESFTYHDQTGHTFVIVPKEDYVHTRFGVEDQDMLDRIYKMMTQRGIPYSSHAPKNETAPISMTTKLVRITITVAILLTTVLVYSWIIMDAWSGKLLYEAGHGWPMLEEHLNDSIPHLFPPMSSNHSAQTLEEICRQLGIDLTETQDKSTESLSSIPQNELNAILPMMKDYVRKELERSQGRVEPPPTEIVHVLMKREEVLATIARVLTTQELPVWTFDIEQGAEAPMPNYVGHIHLHRFLMTQTLSLSANEQYSQAWSYLYASTRLIDALFRRPDLLSQTIATSEAIHAVVMMRKLPGPFPSWVMNWPTQNLDHALLNAYALEAWTVARHARYGVLFIPKDERDKSDFHFFLLSRSYVQASVARMLYVMKRVTMNRMQEGLCTDELSTLGTIEDQLPSWITVSRRSPRFVHFWEFIECSWDLMDLSWQRLYELRVQLEGTRMLHIIKATAPLSSSESWREAVFGEMLPCKQFTWMSTVAPDGSVTLQYTESLQVEKPMLSVSSLKYIDAYEKE